MSTIDERLAASDDPRDAAALRWNLALASGDHARIDAVRDETLDAIHARMMDDGPNYAVAGWKGLDR